MFRALGKLFRPTPRKPQAVATRPLRLEPLENRQLLSVTLRWSGLGTALTLTESTSGATPTVTISEPTPGVSTLKIDLGAAHTFASGSTGSATGLTYQTGTASTSQYATIDISTANNISSLTATLPGDGLTLGTIRDLVGGLGSITATAGTNKLLGKTTAACADGDTTVRVRLLQ